MEVNSGRRVVSKVLPLGWTKADYIEQQIGHEQFSWLSNDTLVYAGNAVDDQGAFQYSKGILNAHNLLPPFKLICCDRRSQGYLFDIYTKSHVRGRRSSR